jgi:hypothetical protein
MTAGPVAQPVLVAYYDRIYVCGFQAYIFFCMGAKVAGWH